MRPLDERGRRQVLALRDLLAARVTGPIASSPYVRCAETVRPLAAKRSLPVDERVELAEGATRSEAFALLEELQGSDLLLCTHGDVILELLGEGMKKGELRVVEWKSDRIRTVG